MELSCCGQHACCHYTYVHKYNAHHRVERPKMNFFVNCIDQEQVQIRMRTLLKDLYCLLQTSFGGMGVGVGWVGSQVILLNYINYSPISIARTPMARLP